MTVYGYAVPNNQGVADVRDLVTLAKHAEQRGFHSAWVSEHLFHAEYVARRLGDRPYHEPLTVLTAIACATETIRLGTSVLVLPWHHPARLGKMVATLDQLSGGRVDLGVGVAVTEDEFANLNIDFHDRGRRTDDTLAALRALWEQDVPRHDGAFYRFAEQRFEPKPRQHPLPVHVGGGAPPALRRTAEFGDGWHALGKSPEELAVDLETLRSLLEARGRPADALHVSIRCVVQFVDEPWDRPFAQRRTLKGTPEEIAGTVAAYVDAGVDEMVFDLASADVAGNQAGLDRLAELFIA